MKNIYSLFIKPNQRKNLVTKLAGAILLLTGLQNFDAQVSTYSFAQSSGTYTPITGTVLGTATGNTATTNLNSAVYPVTLPFTFIYNGTPQNALNVSTNGFVTFGATAPTTSLAAPISSTTAYDGAISAWGRDISSFFDVNGSSGSINWETVGSAPNREVVIQWSNFRPNSSTSATAVYAFSFQIRLKETTNAIQMVYNSGSYLAGTTALDLTAQIGLRGSSNTDFKNRTNEDTVAFTSSSAGTANNASQSFNTTNPVPGMPPAGLTYTFTPSTCFPPASVNTNAITTTGGTVNWTASVPAPSNGYDVYYTTSSAIPANNVTPQFTGVSGTSQVLTSLTPSSTYYVYVRANCGGGNISEWSLTSTFATLCASVSTLSENFDSYATGSIVPLCWERIITTNGTQTISSTGPASGTRNIYQYSTATQNPTVVVLPQFTNVNAGTHWLRLKARISTAGTGALNIGYVTNPSDAGTFNTIQSLTLTNTTYDSTSEFSIPIPTSLPANARLAVMNTADAKGYYWDDVIWEPLPSCLPPSNLNSAAVSSVAGSISWTASTSNPAGGYEYYYSTTNTAPAAGTAPSGTATSSATTASLTGLAANTTYYVWIRSSCSASNKSSWVALPTFTTYCAPVASLVENFDSYATGNTLPDCWDRMVNASGSLSISSTSPASGTRNIYQYSSTTQNPTIAILPNFSNLNAGTHWLRFKARVTVGPGQLSVGYVTDITNASTFVTIQDLNITNTAYDLTSEYTVIVPNTVPANARLAIMNKADAKSYYYDDFYWETVPTCFAPANITTSNATATSATVQWIAPATPPALGYDVYFSTTNTAPTAATTPSYTGVTGTSQVISPLNASTAYYVWVRSRCSATDQTAWVSATGSLFTLCQPPAILSLVGATVCPGNSATLSATAAPGATVKWYSAASGGNLLTTGNSYTTPNLVSTTNYYVSASVGSTAAVGVPNPGALTNGGTTSAGTTFYMEATVANNPVSVQSVDVFPSAAGSASFIRVYLGTATTPVFEIPFTSNVASGGVTPQTIPLNIVLSPGVYRFKIEGAGSYYRNYLSPGGVGQSFPYGQGDFTLTGGSNVTTGYYLFYNFIVGNSCESARQQVTATVDAGCLSTSEIDAAATFNMYPNPVADILYIRSKSKVTDVQIFAASGQRVMNVSEKNIASVNLQSLPSGVYLINITLDNGQKLTKKIVKK